MSDPTPAYRIEESREGGVIVLQGDVYVGHGSRLLGQALLDLEAERDRYRQAIEEFLVVWDYGLEHPKDVDHWEIDVCGAVDELRGLAVCDE